MQTRAFSNPRIHFEYDTVVDEVKGDGMAVKSAVLRNVKTGEVEDQPIDGVFIFIGYDPNSSVFGDQLHTDEQGYAIVDNRMRTNVEGVFAGGEIHDDVFRQAITAAGQGCAAALMAINWLGEREDLLQPLDEATEKRRSPLRATKREPFQ